MLTRKQIRAFEDCVVDFSREYFKKNASKMEKYGVTEQDLIELARSQDLEYLEKKIKLVHNKGDKTDFAIGFSTIIGGCFDPDRNYLDKLLDFLDLIASDEYIEYLDAAIRIQINDYCGGGIHTTTQNQFIGDMKYLEENLGYPDDDRWLATEYRRFNGLVPFLFRKGFTDFYQKAIKYCLFLMERYEIEVGQMIFSLLNFLKKNDQENYEVVYNKFLEIKAKDDGPWTVERNFAHFGLGFQMRRENWSHKSFMDFLD